MILNFLHMIKVTNFFPYKHYVTNFVIQLIYIYIKAKATTSMYAREIFPTMPSVSQLSIEKATFFWNVRWLVRPFGSLHE